LPAAYGPAYKGALVPEQPVLTFNQSERGVHVIGPMSMARAENDARPNIKNTSPKQMRDFLTGISHLTSYSWWGSWSLEIFYPGRNFANPFRPGTPVFLSRRMAR